MLTCFVTCVVLAATAAPAGEPRSDEAALLRLVNSERARRRVAALTWDARLARLARLHAADMRAAGRISHHSTRDGADFTGRLSRTDYRARAAAENVALDIDVTRAHRGLMSSPGHRANILNPDLSAVGIGIVEGDDGALYVVEDFASPLDELSEGEARAQVHAALLRERRRSGLGSFEEDEAVSRNLEAVVKRLAAADTVRAHAEEGFEQGWVFIYTAMEPSSLPRDAERRVARAKAYALALAFRKTRSYPFGVWWIALALKAAG